MTVAELRGSLDQFNDWQEIGIRFEDDDFVILDVTWDFRGRPTIFAMEAGK